MLKFLKGTFSSGEARLIQSALCFFLLLGFHVSAQGTWTSLSSPAPDNNGGVMLLLTDGSVIVKTWYGGYGGTPGTTWDR